tara:strand:+ start:565 stop:1134 length:570 start_codon:yes stop_codon:yes gene_type:complete
MKRLLLIFAITLSFQSLTNAEDIRDFELEGMSIGKSVFDYFDKKEINSKEKLFFPNSKKYYRIAFKLQNNSKYDFIAFYVLNNDKDLIIYGLEGMKYMNFSPCKEKQKKIAYNLKDVFSDFKENSYDGLHDLDNESPFYSIDFDFTNGSTSRIICTDYKKKLEEKGYNDNLAVYLFESKFNTWANTEAY